MNAAIPKPLMLVAGRSLLERCIALYTGCGFRDFVILVGDSAEQIADHLSVGSSLDHVRFHRVPPAETGRGVALASAMDAGVVESSRRGMLVYPDDLFLDPLMPAKVLGDHLHAVRLKSTFASTVFTQGRPWPFGVAEVDDQFTVTAFKEKPFVHQLTAVGTHVFESPAYEMTWELVKASANRPVELERDVIPRFAGTKRLHAVLIPSHTWLPVNTMKDFDEAEAILAAGERPISAALAAARE